MPRAGEVSTKTQALDARGRADVRRVRDAASGRAKSLHLGAGLSRRLRRQSRPAAGAAGPVAALADGRGPQAGTPRPPRPLTRRRHPPAGSTDHPRHLRFHPLHAADAPDAGSVRSPTARLAARPRAGRTAVKTGTRRLPRLALADSQVTARPSAPAGSNHHGKPSMPPAALPPARTAPDLAAPPIEADSSSSPPAVQPHTEWLRGDKDKCLLPIGSQTGGQQTVRTAQGLA